MSIPAISIDNVGKRYLLGTGGGERYRALRDVIANGFKSLIGRNTCGNRLQELWALRNVSLDVNEGQSVGIIGRNGAGKSTLLKLLSQITEPTEGEIHLRGKVSSLLEVGTGFHPELTGRENIFMNGAILGMTRSEIKRKFDEIVSFADIEQFLDTPMKRYSSGMYIRLAFSVAAHLEPDILVVDEVLAVGDIAFQQKCIGKMGDVAKGGRTVLFVSHNMGAIAKLCEKTFLLDQGRLISGGPSNEIIEQYLSKVLNTDAVSAENTFLSDPDKRMQITAMRILQDNGEPGNVLDRALPFKIIIEYEVRQPTEKASIEIVLETILPKHTYILFSLDTDSNPERRNLRQRGRYISTITFPQLILNAGTYQIRAWIWKTEARETHDQANTALQFHLYDSGTEKAIALAGRKDNGVLGIPLRWDTKMLS
jgi:lipopolysaccharide transport system ATP-binding protein